LQSLKVKERLERFPLTRALTSKETGRPVERIESVESPKILLANQQGNELVVRAVTNVERFL